MKNYLVISRILEFQVHAWPKRAKSRVLFWKISTKSEMKIWRGKVVIWTVGQLFCQLSALGSQLCTTSLIGCQLCTTNLIGCQLYTI